MSKWKEILLSYNTEGYVLKKKKLLALKSWIIWEHGNENFYELKNVVKCRNFFHITKIY